MEKKTKAHINYTDSLLNYNYEDDNWNNLQQIKQSKDLVGE